MRDAGLEVVREAMHGSDQLGLEVGDDEAARSRAMARDGAW
jgi:hypothetical protein